MKYIVFFVLLLISITFPNTFAEEIILISITSDLDQAVFDGKWTSNSEWKQSSYNKIKFPDNKEIHLRTAHKDNFVYVQINPTLDKIIDKGADRATVCFDTKNDKTTIPQNDDYCFSSVLDRKYSFTYQGGGYSALNGYFTKIPNHKDFVAVGGISDKNDRYSQQPHPVYEFKIPLELLDRTNIYGFYFEVFDASTHKTYSWPIGINTTGSMTIPSTEQWGDIISPDKSLPEFHSTILFSIVILLMIVFVTITKLNSFRLPIFRY